MLVGVALLVALSACREKSSVTVGSKRFTESYVLSEIAGQLIADAGYSVAQKQGLGGTVIIWGALKNGEINLYPDYTGTIQEVILKSDRPLSPAEMRRQLAAEGIGISEPLGFNNTYAFVMRRDKAERLGIRRISDLGKHPELKLGFSHEFLNREDGWPSISQHYQLAMPNVSGIEHALGYPAVNNGTIDIMDAYSTDAKLGRYDLTILEDDRQFFPEYHAVYLYRLDTEPAIIEILQGLGGTLNEKQMIALNAAAEESKDYAGTAAEYLGLNNGSGNIPSSSSAGRIFGWILEHLWLVFVSLLMAIIIGLPLGIRASKPGAFSQFILGSTGVLQTIPSLALLALFAAIPFLGIGTFSAIVALFLYSLLPIVRNTASGLRDIPLRLRESAAVLGLSPRAQLFKIFLPMASRTILTGIKTSAVINVGTATLAALIGAGGLGEPIISGLSLNDSATILQGAIPAALLAILVQGGFELLDRIIIPKGLQIQAEDKQ